MLGNKKAPRSLPLPSGLAQRPPGGPERRPRARTERAAGARPAAGKAGARGARGVHSHVLTGRGPHRRLEHLLTDGAIEIVFRVGRGRREVFGHGGGWAGRATAPVGARVAVAALGPRPRQSPEGGGSGVRKRLAQEAASARKGAGLGGGAERRDKAAARAGPAHSWRTRAARRRGSAGGAAEDALIGCAAASIAGARQSPTPSRPPWCRGPAPSGPAPPLPGSTLRGSPAPHGPPARPPLRRARPASPHVPEARWALSALCFTGRPSAVF